MQSKISFNLKCLQSNVEMEVITDLNTLIVSANYRPKIGNSSSAVPFYIKIFDSHGF